MSENTERVFTEQDGLRPGWRFPDAGAEKLANVLAMICRKRGGEEPLESAIGILYLAERMHLAAYGRMICRSKYLADISGMAPAMLPQALQVKRVDGAHYIEVATRDDDFAILRAVMGPDMERFSKSEVTCLREACAVSETWGEQPQARVDSARAVRKDEAWQVHRGKLVGAIDIARHIPGIEDLVPYLQES